MIIMPTHPAIPLEIEDSCLLSSNLYTHPCSYMTHSSNGAISNVYINPVHPEGDQSWVFTGRTDAEAETPILWPPDGKS